MPSLISLNLVLLHNSSSMEAAVLWLSLLLLPLFLLTLAQKFMTMKKPNFLPGPPRLPFIGNLHQLGELPHQSLAKLAQTHGPVMFLQFGRVPALVVSSAETAKEILKTQDLEFCSRPPLGGPKRLSYDFLDIAFAPYNEYWKEIRKLCVHELLSVKRVQSFGFIRTEEISILIDSISRSTQQYSETPIDVSEKLMSLTNHIICRMAFGNSYRGKNQFGDEGKFEKVLFETSAMLGCFSAMDFFPSFIGKMVDVISGLHGRLEKSFHDLDNFYQAVIDEHEDPQRLRSSSELEEDIIDVLLKLEKDQLAGVGLSLTKKHLKAILMNIFIAGVDTSAITLVWAMSELAKKPEAMKKVQQEIRNYIGNKGKVEETDLDQLEYMKMVVKETLRLHPPGPLLLPRESMQHTKINGFDVVPKTRVLVNVWAIGRSPLHWDKPEEFIPERFLDSSIDFRGQNFDFLPFGGGRRGCPGLNLGIAMIELSLANLLYSFDWELPRGMKKEDLDMDESPGLTVHKKYALHLVPIKYKWEKPYEISLDGALPGETHVRVSTSTIM